MFYFGRFHILHFLFPSPKHNSLSRCFLVQRRPQQLGRVKCNEPGRQYVFPCKLLIFVVLCCFNWSISHLTLSSSSSQTHNSLLGCFLVQCRHQQLGRVKCDDLAKQYVFPCQLLIHVVVVLLLFYLVDFTSYTFFFLLLNTTAFYGASSFNADVSQWVVSSVTRLDSSKSSCQLLIVVVLC